MKYEPTFTTKTVKELSLDAARHRFLLRNIGIQIIGFGGEFWDKYEITWSQNGNKISVKELRENLRRIVREEENMEIPDKPPERVPDRRAMQIFENDLTAELRELDTKYFNQVGKYR